MNAVYSKTEVAWKIFQEVFERSAEEFVPYMTHPCSEQYECLSILRVDQRNAFNVIASINLNGTSILMPDNSLLQYEAGMSDSKIDFLAEKMIRAARGMTMDNKRPQPGMEFIKQLLKRGQNRLRVFNAWYDGSYDSYLTKEIIDFSYYSVGRSEKMEEHLPWWVVTLDHKTICICNLKSHVLVTADGVKYDLTTEFEEALAMIFPENNYNEFDAYVAKARELLLNNPEWRERYNGYADAILANHDYIKTVRQSFREWNPLKVYLNVSNAKKATKTVRFELRYLGQTVADLIYDQGMKLDTKRFSVLNKRDFDCGITLAKVAWDGTEAREFRTYFKKREHIRNSKKDNAGNEEHRLESLWLTEFSKTKDKIMPFIKPVKVGNVRFPMPTPLSASDHKKLKYANFSGGGIDILTRTGTGGSATNLCILELKDENVKSEPPKDALKQALAYATFIRELLRSESGDLWWKIFGFSGKIPHKLVLFAACIMPSNQNNDKSFEGVECNIDGDIIKLHYVYFTEEKNKIIQVETSLPNCKELKIQQRDFSMKITIYRGTHELGGTLIELKSGNSRILLDAGYPLFLDGKAIDDGIAVLPVENLLELGVLPKIEGLYNWDKAGFDALIISHSHIDHYGLLPYVHPDIPVYLSEGTARIIRISQTFKIVKNFQVNQHRFTMYLHFRIGDFRIKPFLMDHSAFDAAAFEISCEGKTVIYSGDYRGHGRKAVCLDCLISGAKKNADLLLVEGSTLGRVEEESLTEEQLEQKAKGTIEKADGIVLFQCSSQNIDRLVSFYKATIASGRTLVVDVYTANVLHELRQLGNNLPYPSNNYPGIKVFFPYRLTNKIFKIIGEEYAKQFAAFHISRETLIKQQNNIVMIVRPSMLMDLKKCAFKAGVFIYSMWGGYRNSEYQQKMEKYLLSAGFHDVYLHTSGHASVADIKKLIAGIHPKKIVPIHTMHPAMFLEYSDKVALQEDGIEFKVD